MSGRGRTAFATESRLHGHPVQVVDVSQDHQFTLNEEALENILLNPDVKDKNVVVVSVAGAFRNGKSFLLDFFLRYMNAQSSSSWLGDENSPLEGFLWRGGVDGVTTGILMWSEPFIVDLPSSEKVAVLFMDTQGMFDCESTVEEDATVFALSTMLSSVLVYNITSNIHENHLQHLQLFIEYGRLALEHDSTKKPFQTLQFLVRDWSKPYTYEYGNTGGNSLLAKRLQVNDRQHEELQQVRKHIQACFDKMSCFLMPHPGLKTATNHKFDGRLSDIEMDFKEQLRKLVHNLLAPENLVVKQIHGNKVTGKELVEYFKAYIYIYQRDELPEPKTMLQTTAEAHNVAAFGNAKDQYNKDMESIVGGHKPFIGQEHLERQHQRCRTAALDAFKSKRKMGGDEFSQTYLEKLISEIEELHENFLKKNNYKS